MEIEIAAAPAGNDASEARPVLRLTNLSKSFGGVQALDRVGLQVGRGEVHGLLGQNGSGKSTLIKILSGFHAPDPGGQLWIVLTLGRRGSQDQWCEGRVPVRRLQAELCTVVVT